MTLTIINKKEISVCADCPFCRQSINSNTSYCERVYPSITLFQAYDKIIENCPIKRRRITVKGKGALGEFVVTP